MSSDPAVTTAGRRVNTGQRARLATIRSAFGVLDRVAPAVSARWALRLWSALPTARGLRRDERPGDGRRSTVALPRGRDVVVETWGEGEPVYLVHGWGGWRGQLGMMITPLVAAGRRVVAFDAPSHGESGPGHLGPRRSTAVEMMDAFAAVAAAHGTPSAVVGHSLGATVATLVAADGLDVGRLALVAPSADVLTMTEVMARRLGYGPRTKRRFDALLESMAGRPLRDFDLTGHAITVPALVVHDKRDKEVPHAQGVQIAEAWPNAALLSTDGLGHQRILRDPGVIQAVSRFATGY